MTTFGMGLASLRRRRLRAVSALLSVALALAMLCLSLSATARVRGSLGGFDDTSIMLYSFRGEPMPFAYVNEARQVARGKGTVEYNAITPCEDKEKGDLRFVALGASDDYFWGAYPPTIYGVTREVHEAFLKDRQGVIVSQDLLRRMGWKVGAQVVLPAAFGPIQAHIVGVSTGAITFTVVMHYDYLDSLRPQKAGLWSIIVRKTTDTPALIEALEQRFAMTEPQVLVMREKAFHAYIMRMSGAIPAMLEKIAVVFGLCTLFLVLSNALVATKERRAEFGALRAIGFSRLRVLAVIVSEFVALGVVAGVLGCGVPYLLWRNQGIHLGELALDNVTLDGAICLGVMIAAIVLGSLVTLIPAIALARANAVDLLENG